MKPYEVFASRFGGEIVFNQEFIVERSQRFYLLNPRLKKTQANFYYAGLYLGKAKDGAFFPSFNLLNLLLNAASNKIVVDEKAAWLFICGRDIFRKSIQKVMGSKRKGDVTLVLNGYNECLGFGKILDLSEAGKDKVAVSNILDVGDFLRREARR